MAAKLGAEEIISKILHIALEKQEITDTSVSNKNRSFYELIFKYFYFK